MRDFGDPKRLIGLIVILLWRREEWLLFSGGIFLILFIVSKGMGFWALKQCGKEYDVT